MAVTSIAPVADATLDAAELARMDAYWRAANYLSVGQIYLKANPLLREPLALEHVKPRLLGHWGTTPGLNFIYVHLNRVIRQRDLNVIYITGPGHGGPGLVANTYLEGTYSEIYPDVSEDEDGMRRLFKQFSFPGGVPSHVAAEVPGSIHEGGELGYALSHAFGAAFDNPDLVAACVIGDGEAETGPLAASWHSNKFLDPVRDGAVLPILHLNGYKISNPTVLARIEPEELESLLVGYGWKPYFVEGSRPGGDPPRDGRDARHGARRDRRDPGRGARERTGAPPALADDRAAHAEGLDRAEGGRRPQDRGPLALAPGAARPRSRAGPTTSSSSRRGCAATGPRSCSTPTAGSCPSCARSPPRASGAWARTRTPTAARCCAACGCPTSATSRSTSRRQARRSRRPRKVLGGFLNAVMRRNLAEGNFRLFAPDENASNRLQAVYETTGKTWLGRELPDDEDLAADGRVMEILSEHTCQGWLEGYLLTGRHGLFSCYEAFIHIVDSMFNQHAKWLKTTRELAWRAPIASLNYLLTSHVWRQDHNGFSHQDPGFIDHVVNKKADIVRVWLPPDANTLLAIADQCLRSRDLVNVIVAGKQPAPQFLDMNAAIRHTHQGRRDLGLGEQRPG